MVVVLDSNIWISFALNMQLDFVASLHENKIKIAGCKHLLDELIIVTSRPKFKKYFSGNYLEKFILFYQVTTTNFAIANIEPVVSDEKDNYLFALCKAAKADYFVTGDKLLLSVNKYQETSVITLTDFKNIVQ